MPAPLILLEELILRLSGSPPRMMVYLFKNSTIKSTKLTRIKVMKITTITPAVTSYTEMVTQLFKKSPVRKQTAFLVTMRRHHSEFKP